MIAQKNLKSILNGVAGAALVVGFSLAPLNIDIQGGKLVLTNVSAFASGPGSHQGGNMGGNMGQNNENSQEHNNMGSNDHMSDNDMSSEMGNSKGEHAQGNHDEDAGHANRPMDLQDFMESLRNGVTIVNAEKTDELTKVTYSDGWSEEISNGRYKLKAPNGHSIISRDVTQRDIDRLNSAF
ncbi:MAG TPA: hypothetical protein ENK61_05010 [Devosia sp.]|nr:hypothetical protein [Devosia sp.]